eukprot:350951-Chlamydomonas_euryale.AAC.8
MPVDGRGEDENIPSHDEGHTGTSVQTNLMYGLIMDDNRAQKFHSLWFIDAADMLQQSGLGSTV